MTPNEDLILGLDLGIASIGWAVIKDPAKGGGIVAMGVRTFDVPETDKERTPTNHLRRQHRGLRRVFRRRRQRMRDLRKLFFQHGVIESVATTSVPAATLDPWAIRGAALDRKLSPRELAVALAHIAKHRGFKSNSKRDRGANAPSDSSKMLKAIAETQARMGPYRTVGEMFAKDDMFAWRKRNSDGEFTRSILRDDQAKEVALIFDAQRRMENKIASHDLESAYTKIAFFQRPLADSEDKVGPCNFEPSEKRAAKCSPSFELFRFLSRLAALRIKTKGDERGFTPQEISDAAKAFGDKAGMTFKRLREIQKLDGGVFDACPVADEAERDVVNRAKSNGCSQGTHALKKTLGDAGWASIAKTEGMADRLAFVLTFREDIGSIRKGLEELGLEPLVVEATMKGVESGAFAKFKGAGHISAKAARRINPFLAQGMVYSSACEKAGYNHALRSETDLDSIANPIARKSITECLKQTKAIIHAYGLPGAIHVELARDVGKSKEERDEIRFGLEKRNKYKDKLAEEFETVTGREPNRRSDDMMRFELWKEQHGRCLYTDREIHPDMILSSDRTVEVDHILPWSRSGDDSFVNKTLCFASANQDKRQRTPFEWLGTDAARWDGFVARVESCKYMKGRKKRNYCLKDASVLEEKFRSRNLNDTKYATRVVLELLAKHYADDVRTLMKSGAEAEKAARAWYEGGAAPKGRVRVQSRPGALTSRLWRGWGINAIMKKKDGDGRRASDDRHHALDALIVAATTASQLQRLTKAWQESEKVGSRRDFSDLPPPWATFLEETHKHFTELFVSRAERRRARGEGHAATIRQVAETDDGAKVYERKAVGALTLKDLDRVKDPERNKALIEALRDWIERGKPEKDPPKSPKGDPISKVRLLTNKKVDVLVREGAADRGEMTRVDVFRKKSRRGSWEYYLVPIYPHQIMDSEDWPGPPMGAISNGKDEAEWPLMDQNSECLWSLFPLCFLEIEKSDGTLLEGYYRSTDRGTAAITISPSVTNQVIVRGIGVKTLRAIRKFSIDRLGNRFEIVKETRTWHGKVCT